MKIILLLLVVFFCSQVMMTFVKRDVCILGSGASGMSSAVFLKDRGYKNVLVIEKDDKIGGHCDSSYFTPPSPGQQDWLELGVVVFPDTAKENATGIGKWTLGSREFAQRFLPPNGTFPYGGFVPSYGFDFNRRFSVGLLPNNPPTQEYIDAYIRFNTILATQYPWIENANIPDPIPPVLLKPFGDFITANNLSAINSLFYSLLYFGGMGNFKTVTTLYALQNLRRGVTTIYSDPSYGFAIKGGCLKMYNGMANYIGTNNIVTGATVLTVNRAIPNNIIVVYKKGFLVKTEICEKLIVSFPQLLNRMGFIDLNQEETSIFQKVEANYYYNYRIEAQGPITQNSPFNLVSLDIVDPDQIPPFPNILVLRRELAYGPTSGFAYALTDIPESQMYNIVNQYLGYIPSSYLTNISISWFDQHLYQAHFPVSALSQSPTPYTKLKNLQGKRGTYWTGALFSFAETASIWQKTYDLITQNFPKKN